MPQAMVPSIPIVPSNPRDPAAEYVCKLPLYEELNSRCLCRSPTPLRVIVANSRRSGSGALGRFNLSTIDIPLPTPSIPVFTVFTNGPEPAFSANVDALLSTTERAWRIA
ncbi:hypothetical protein BGY98DRAFT_1101784 [Russula aff. rugulosa BPL654]|nr:hypothetical protein BGY98DRAFT_1101784 [Russula aff. rugulosa BPL654]